MVSYSPTLAISPAEGDGVIITLGQSNDMFWGPVAHVTAVPNCCYINPRVTPHTLKEGRDTLYNYPIPADTQANFPPLESGQHRGGSAWTWFMRFFNTTAAEQRPATRLLICQCGDHSQPSSQFVPGTAIHDRVLEMRDWLSTQGWDIWYINVAQGESDAAGMVSGEDYTENWHAAVDGFRSEGIEAPVIMDTNTQCRLLTPPFGSGPAGLNFEAMGTDWAARNNRFRGERAIRDAQAACLDNTRKIYRGIDADMIQNRIDGCHHGQDGQSMLGYWRYSMLFEHIAAGRIPAL